MMPGKLMRRWTGMGGAALFASGTVGPIVAQGPAPTPPTAFVDVTVIPMDRERVLPHQTVVVRGSWIVAVGPTNKVAVPVEAVRVDGRGKFLIPGLADMHAHPVISFNPRGPSGDTFTVTLAEARRILFLHLANGVTTLRVMGYAGPAGLVLRDEVENGTLAGPRMYVGAGPVDDLAPDSVGPFIQAAKRAGYDFIKVHGVSGAVFDSAVAAAQRVKLPVAGHPPEGGSRADSALGIPGAIRQHLQSVEHQIGLMTVADAQRYAAALKQAGVWVCPTLVQHNHGRGQLRDSTWPESRYLWPNSRILDERHPLPAELLEQQRAIKVLQDSGVGLLLGTDAFVGGVPGFSVHRELAALVAAGLTPYQALLTGTRNVAAYFGTSDLTGTIAAGRRADLVLLAANPLQDIRATAQVVGVVQGGHWWSRAALDAVLQLLEHFYMRPPFGS